MERSWVKLLSWQGEKCICICVSICTCLSKSCNALLKSCNASLIEVKSCNVNASRFIHASFKRVKIKIQIHPRFIENPPFCFMFWNHLTLYRRCHHSSLKAAQLYVWTDQNCLSYLLIRHEKTLTYFKFNPITPHSRCVLPCKKTIFTFPVWISTEMSCRP